MLWGLAPRKLLTLNLRREGLQFCFPINDMKVGRMWILPWPVMLLPAKQTKLHVFSIPLDGEYMELGLFSRQVMFKAYKDSCSVNIFKHRELPLLLDKVI